MDILVSFLGSVAFLFMATTLKLALRLIDVKQELKDIKKLCSIINSQLIQLNIKIRG